jgi:hypothetical protein
VSALESVLKALADMYYAQMLPGPAKPSRPLQPKTTAFLAPSTVTYHIYTFFHDLQSPSSQKYLMLPENSKIILTNLFLNVSF